MKKYALDQMIVYAKEEGDRKWQNITQKYGVASGQTPPKEAFDEFADYCENPDVFFLNSPKGNNLRALEAFLRAGKHMPAAVKADNRRKADKLYDELLKEG